MRILSKVLFGCMALATSFSLMAQDAKPATPNPVRPNAGRMNSGAVRPQGGKLVSVDKKAQTMTVAPMPGPISTLTSNMVVHFSTNTIFVKTGKRVAVDEITPDTPIRFQVRKTPEGKDMAALVVVVTAPPPRSLPVPPSPGATPKTK